MFGQSRFFIPRPFGSSVVEEGPVSSAQTLLGTSAYRSFEKHHPFPGCRQKPRKFDKASEVSSITAHEYSWFGCYSSGVEPSSIVIQKQRAAFVVRETVYHIKR
jgi:hypothetical protein